MKISKAAILLLCIIFTLCCAACKDTAVSDTGADTEQSQNPSGDNTENNTNDNTADNTTNNGDIQTPPADNTDNTTENNPPADPVTPTPVGNMNPLTGLYDGISDAALNHRPVAVMIGNSYSALPQQGIGSADIIYEMLAEGRITRLMAIYQDYTKIEKISGIRSARPYFIDIAQSYGAAFVHFGASEPAVEQIALRDDLIDIDGIKWPLEEIAFYRDADIKASLGSEHSVSTNGELLKVAFDRQAKSLEQTDHPSAFNFSDSSSAANGNPMTKVQITYKSNHKPYFVYDQASGEYLRYQYNQDHIDGLTSEQISVKNVLILRMHLDDLDHYLDIVDIQTVGSGLGYYFCEGKYVEITWQKDAYNSPITYYTLDGKELVCKPGQTFVSVVTEDNLIEIE
ncbi:MAG: DUF3048 domain-containing protein [Clostridia bacterium]|nr:DUF3048 domain-containing protein [Clostridia bacterium]